MGRTFNRHLTSVSKNKSTDVLSNRLIFSNKSITHNISTSAFTALPIFRKDEGSYDYEDHFQRLDENQLRCKFSGVIDGWASIYLKDPEKIEKRRYLRAQAHINDSPVGSIVNCYLRSKDGFVNATLPLHFTIPVEQNDVLTIKTKKGLGAKGAVLFHSVGTSVISLTRIK